MERKKVQSLKVIEIPYGDIGWGTDPHHIRKGIHSDVQHWKGPRELDDYKLCGVYYKAGVPFEIKEIVYTHNKEEEVYQTLTKAVSDEVFAGLRAEKSILITGGYCIHGLAVTGGIQRAIGSDKKLGIVWMDAHSDLNIPETTTSGMLGGMPLAAMLGVGLDEWRKLAGVEVPLDDRNVILSDYRVNDKGATENLKKLGLTWLNTEDFHNQEKWKEAVDALAQRVDAIYLHVDIDVLDGKYVPDHVTIAMGGPEIDVVMRNIKTVMETGKIIAYSVNDVYFDNDLPGKEMSALSGMRLLGAGLESWESCPDL